MMEQDRRFLERAFQVALKAEAEGNMPIGALLVLDGEIISEGGNSILHPEYNPGLHAEMMTFRGVESRLWPRAQEMTLYSTLEPCLMCMGSAILHGVGRVVYGARDPEGGAHYMLKHLPSYYQKHRDPLDCEGPLMADLCDPLYLRARARFLDLPCG